MNTYALLCWEFFKTGLFSVGGGLATLPFLYDMGARHGWFDAAQLTDMVAVSESTPGPIGVNMATYVGFTTAGLGGAVLATLSLVAPAILVILAVSRFLDRFRESRNVQDAFYGLRPAVTGLIAAAGFQVFMLAMFDQSALQKYVSLRDISPQEAVLWPSVALLAVLLPVLLKTKWHPVAIIGMGAVAGIVLGL